mgnify:CR=1 FL=1
MRGMTRVVWWAGQVGVILLCVGCATGGGPQISADSLPPCEVPAPPTEDWRQVVAEGISFCLPADWRSAGSKVWRGDGGSNTWGFGEPRRELRGMMVAVRAEDLPNPPPLPGSTNRLVETIGGVSVELWINTFGGETFTGAQWTEPQRFYVTGEASSPIEGQRQLNVFRTARIHERRP